MSLLRLMGVVIALAVLSGCATVPGRAVDARDPWEGMNRSVYSFNDTVDRVAVKPLAKAYVNVVPSPVRTGVNNFFGNLGDVWNAANSLLQFKGQAAAESAMRVVVNTTFGLAGLLDVATEMRLPKHKEDFGQTLGYWGVPPGPYVVLPLFGPSTVRDTTALPLDMKADLVGQVSDVSTRNSLSVLQVTDKRAGLLQATDAITGAALDPYSFVRDAFLQKRRNDVYDGNPPGSFDYSDPDLQ
jgi:phospholipid-binding lipoprotein MlaA